MFDLKKELLKKNIFLALSIIFALLLVLGLIFVIINEDISTSVIVPPLLLFQGTCNLYKNSKKAINENSKM